ncbi:hypothetical protein ACVME8_000140 [Bradyrhizobium diazoefficiens]
MARADSNHTTKLSSQFRDPFLRAAFKAAEDDGLAPVDTDRPKTLRGGDAALPELEAA